MRLVDAQGLNHEEDVIFNCIPPDGEPETLL
jgi:hypothetical protein